MENLKEFLSHGRKMKFEIEESAKSDDTGIEDKIKSLAEYRVRMLDIIFQLNDTLLRKILILYYIYGKRWQDVADEVHYEVRYVQKLSDKAIKICQNKKGD